jgi:hypothetical protein
MNAHLGFLLSCVYDGGGLHPPHLADLRKSGLTDETIARQKIRSVPPSAISPLLGFPTPKVNSALLFPFANPAGGWMDHIRVKVFPTLKTRPGTVKYLQPRHSDVRLYFPLSALDQVLHGDAPILFTEGEKKSLSVSQLGVPAVGFCGIEGWHVGGTRDLLPDFDAIPLRGRTVKLIPDGDVETNPHVRRGAVRFAKALEQRGARVELVTLPSEAVAA